MKKSLTLNGLLIPNFIFLLLSLGMFLVSAYMTQHYLQTHFPSELDKVSSFCNINDFWSCDVATLSPLGNINGIPTSLFGLIVGLIGLMTAILGKKSLEETAKPLFLVNFLGCLGLLSYSLIALKGLCPWCTVYYILSGLAYFMLHKFSDLDYRVDAKVSGVMACLALIPLVGMSFHIGSKEKEKVQQANAYIQSFKTLQDYGDPTTESPYKIHMATEDFSSGKIRISIFSDFQCPYCQKAADQVQEILADFKEQVNIQYFFYPLDSTCNEKMKGGSPHPFACMAAYLAACDPAKFAEVHDYIFANQSAINLDSLKKWEAKFELSGCQDNAQLKNIVQQTLKAGEQFKLRSTPTIIINGKKIEGLVPYQYLKGMLQSLIQ